MKTVAKKILGSFGLYAPMQQGYRQFRREVSILKLKYSWRRFKGPGITCNVCGASYTRFVPHLPSPVNAGALKTHSVIAGYGENIFCPACYSNARDRLIVAILNEEDLSAKKVLHFAPERNVFNFLKKKSASVSTCDLMPDIYSAIDKNIRKENIMSLSFADQSFDLVIANHVMEHIPDDRKAMQEIFRVLKKGGQAILQVPFSETLPATIEEPDIDDPARQSALFGQRDHIRIYAMNDYASRLRTCGFQVQVIPAESLSKYRQHAIRPEEVFYLIKKG